MEVHLPLEEMELGLLVGMVGMERHLLYQEAQPITLVVVVVALQMVALVVVAEVLAAAAQALAQQ